MFSELAAGSWSSGTSLGRIALRVGWLTAKNACCTANSPSSSHTLPRPSAACSQNAALVRISPRRGDEQQGAPVHHVGERAAVQAEHDERDQSEQAGQPDVRRGAGDLVDLRGHRDDRQLGADDRDDVGQPEPAEVLAGEGPGVGDPTPAAARLGMLSEWPPDCQSGRRACGDPAGAVGVGDGRRRGRRRDRRARACSSTSASPTATGRPRSPGPPARSGTCGCCARRSRSPTSARRCSWSASSRSTARRARDADPRGRPPPRGR